MKLIGTPLCIHCDEAQEYLKQEGIDYEYFNLTEDIYKLKDFLRIRDSRNEFDSKKQDNKVAVPCFYFEDDYITFDLDDAAARYKAGHR